jgi:XTP/dITP diphosphohydrolase
MELVIASTNVHKIRELRSMLKACKKFDLLSLIDFSHYVQPEETGATLKENAILKAEHAAKTLNRHVIADDSGLVIPALNGAPGVYSRRYAGEKSTDKDNRRKLLSELIGVQDTARQGYYECWIALASPQGLEKCVKGVTEGMITDEEKGSLGFGYDSIFIKHEYGRTFAELDEEIKNRISHRRKALDKLMPFLEALAE